MQAFNVHQELLDTVFNNEEFESKFNNPEKYKIHKDITMQVN